MLRYLYLFPAFWRNSEKIFSIGVLANWLKLHRIQPRQGDKILILAELTIRECLIRYLYTSPFIVVVRNIINSVVDQSHGEAIENALKNETLNSWKELIFYSSALSCEVSLSII